MLPVRYTRQDALISADAARCRDGSKSWIEQVGGRETTLKYEETA